MPRHMVLGTFMKADGEHIAAWRHPSTTDVGGNDIRGFLTGAQIAERGKLDFVFMGDVAANAELPAEMLARTSWLNKLEPLTVLTAVAMVTSRIGIVGTATTTYNEPYALARRLCSIDHVSNGRAGWNLVTSMNHTDAMNYGHAEHASLTDRYDRAGEFLEVCRGLWDSWGDDSFICDKAGGRYFTNESLPYLHHEGKHFKVRGPLDQARPPQGHLPIVLAGTSEDGRALAAKSADMTFTSQQDFKAAKEFYADMKRRVAANGRRPESFVVLNGLQPVLAETRDEAEAKYRQLQDMMDANMAVSLLTTLMGGIDLSKYPLDEPIPPLPPAKGLSSRRDMLVEIGRRENLTLRQLAVRVAGSRGHLTLVGTPGMIADQMEQWFREGAADGYLFLPPVNPDSLTDIVELLLPELRRRGLFRTEYEGRTLRELLGLPRPEAPPRN